MAVWGWGCFLPSFYNHNMGGEMQALECNLRLNVTIANEKISKEMSMVKVDCSISHKDLHVTSQNNHTFLRNVSAIWSIQGVQEPCGLSPTGRKEQAPMVDEDDDNI